MANKSGELVAGYYNGVYLKLNWEAIENRKIQKYTIKWNVTKHGDGSGYFTWIHYLRVYFNGNRFESTDVAKKAYDGDIIAEGSFEIDAGEYDIELHGGIYYYAENVSNKTREKLDSITPLNPIVIISKVSNTATTITIKCSDANSIKSEKYHVYNGKTFLKESNEKEITLENLTPSTKYSIKVYGYGNGAFGPESNILYITTSKQSIITNIGNFNINGTKITLSGEGNIVVFVNGKELIRRNNVPSGEYELILTNEEKQKIYELMGNVNNIEVIIRIETGNSYIDKEANITLTGDVFSCNININGIKKRCKVWVGTSSGNKQGIFTIGTSKGNVRGR